MAARRGSEGIELTGACRAAVVRAFDQMRETGACVEDALTVATRVYRHHHPDADIGLAHGMVERWLFAGMLH